MSKAVAKHKTVTVPVELSDDEAWVLAQMAKRFTYEHAHELSDRHQTYDGVNERDVMIGAVNKLQRALREKGFAPR